MQNAELNFLLYIEIYEPYGDTDKDTETEGIAPRRMGHQPVNLMQSKLQSVGQYRVIGGDWHHLCVNGYKLREGLQL